MSAVGEIVRDSAVSALAPLSEELGQEFLQGLSGILEGASDAAKNKVAGLVKQGFEFRRRALVADTAEEAREYAEAAAKSARRVKTVLLAESVVAQESTAALVSGLLEKALDGMAALAKGLVVEIVKSLAASAVEGITGEDGGDPAEIFPFT